MKTATQLLSAENSSTASLILPTKMSIVKQLNATGADEDEESTDAVIHEAKMTIKHDLETRYII